MGQPSPRWPQRRSAKRSSFAKRCVCPVLAVASQGAVDAGHNRPICHLKTGKKRSELYAKVWAQPISRLAKELGISDVGLPRPAAVTRCPPHRAAIGPSSMRARRRFEPLPTPELDVVVHFATSDPQERERQKLMERRRTEALNA
jgi:hypothetical protein